LNRQFVIWHLISWDGCCRIFEHSLYIHLFEYVYQKHISCQSSIRNQNSMISYSVIWIEFWQWVTIEILSRTCSKLWLGSLTKLLISYHYSRCKHHYSGCEHYHFLKLFACIPPSIGVQNIAFEIYPCITVQVIHTSLSLIAFNSITLTYKSVFLWHFIIECGKCKSDSLSEYICWDECEWQIHMLNL